MLQVLQSVRDGRLDVVDVPPPARSRGFAIVETARSAISPGTERAVMDLARSSLISKAQKRPDLVRQVVEKVTRDGVMSTFAAVTARLDATMPLGYSCAGVVVDVDGSVPEISVGDRVACGGAGYAVHAEVVRIPKHLLVRIPDEVSFDDAAFTTIGAIALQGVRIADPRLGECVVVIGLGLVGLLTTQLLVAAGIRVVGVDPAKDRAALAVELGAALALSPNDDVANAVRALTDGIGADAVVVSASSTSNDPLVLAGEVARHRARISLVGATGMEIPRRSYYEKELAVALSTSYGPGRYDPTYEEAGHDYPVGYVRWTEQRNMIEVVRLLASKQLRIAPLRTHSFPISNAKNAYDLIADPGTERPLGVVLEYPVRQGKRVAERPVARARRSPQSGKLGIALVGAGSYAGTTLLPAMRSVERAEVRVIVSRGGQSAHDLARRFGVPAASSDLDAVLGDPTIDAVLIATRHDSHAALTVRALDAGKHVLVEKPPAITKESLELVGDAFQRAGRVLFVGYNRDFAPVTLEIKKRLGGAHGAAQIVLRCNAGPVPSSHWVHDPELGGGRWIGEGCHFVALACALAGSLPVAVSATETRVPGSPGNENVQATIDMKDGSAATIVYTALGDRAFSKERVEIFAGGAAAVIDDWRRWSVVIKGKESKGRAWVQDKGQSGLLRAFVEACRTGSGAEITERMLAATRATLAAAESITTGRRVEL